MAGSRLTPSFLLIVLLLGLSELDAQESPPKVILVSWDGAAYWMASRLLDRGALPNLKRMVQEGAWSDGMITSFPSKTAPAHAMLWTGHYGHRSGITGNILLRTPPAVYSRLQTISGYFSSALRAEPLWMTTVRAGLPTYSLHATQSYPFEPFLAPLSEAERDRLYLLSGYTEVELPAAVLRSETAPAAPAKGWAIPEAMGPEAREVAITVGGETFWALFFDDPFDPAEGCDTMGLVRDKTSSVFDARIKGGPGQSFSHPIRTSSDEGVELFFGLRLFELSPDGGEFLLYRTGAAKVALSFDNPAGETLSAFSGNGGGSIYHRGGFGKTLAEGGDGEAEARVIETAVHLVDQIRMQTDWVLERGDYRLFILYLPLPDELAHRFAGYLDPAVPDHDPELARKLWPAMEGVFAILDGLLGRVLDAAERDGANVLLVSDHGMAGTRRLVHLNVALERAGLLATTADRRIDLTRTRALAPHLADASIAVNSRDRPGGIVPETGRGEVLAEVERVLAELVDPDTGERIVTGFFPATRSGLLQPGGEAAGELFLDFAPGYYPSTSTSGTELVSDIPPEGNHIFLPTRRDMLAICAAWGPRVPNASWQRVRAIDIAPTVLTLLGLVVPRDLPGRTLVPPRPLVPETKGDFPR